MGRARRGPARLRRRLAFLYAAARARAVSYAVYGGAWLAVCLTGRVLSLVYPDNSSPEEFGSFLTVVTWFAGFGQAFAMRGAWARRVRAHDADPIVGARTGCTAATSCGSWH